MALRSTLEQIRQDGAGSNTPSILFNAVLPVLSDLGWTDRGQIDLERGDVDIALSLQLSAVDHSAGQPVALIKVDASGAPSQRDVTRLLKLARRDDAVFGVFTTGQIWWLYLAPHEADDVAAQFAVVDIQVGAIRQVEDAFTRYLARDAIANGAARRQADEALTARRNNERLRIAVPQVWRQLLAAPDSLLVTLVQEEVKKEVGLNPSDEHVAAVIMRTVVPDIRQDTPTQTPGQNGSQANPKPPRQRPTGYRLWGETYRVKYQREILTGVAEAIYVRHASTFDRITTLSSYFTKRPSERVSAIRIGSSEYYHEGSMNFNRVMELAHKLLQAFGYSPSAVEVLYDVPPGGAPVPLRRGKRRRRRVAQPPTSIRLWGETYSITRQYDVLTIVATQLYERHADVFERALALAVITTDPTTRSAAMRIGQSEYYHEKALERDRLRRICDHLLRLFDYEPSDLELIYE